MSSMEAKHDVATSRGDLLKIHQFSLIKFVIGISGRENQTRRQGAVWSDKDEDQRPSKERSHEENKLQPDQIPLLLDAVLEEEKGK
jgi:hypothetical protein